MTVADIATGRDSYVAENAATTNYGTSTVIRAGDEGGKTTNTDRMLLYFDASSLVGAGVVGSDITAVTLTYYSQGGSGSGSPPYQHGIYKLKNTRQDWVEGEVTWNIYKTANSWTTAGGDYEATTPTPFTFDVPTTPGSKTLGSDANLVGLIADAIDNEGGHIHLLWKEVDESTTVGWRTDVSSREHPIDAIPTLHITYSTGGAAGQPILRRTAHIPFAALGQHALRRRA